LVGHVIDLSEGTLELWGRSVGGVAAGSREAMVLYDIIMSVMNILELFVIRRISVGKVV
jgi:hypothetical protein